MREWRKLRELHSALSNFRQGQLQGPRQRHSIAWPRRQQDYSLLGAACGYVPDRTMSRGSIQSTRQVRGIISCPPAAVTRGLGGRCTDTQCHRQRPKGQRMFRHGTHWIFQIIGLYASYLRKAI